MTKLSAIILSIIILAGIPAMATAGFFAGGSIVSTFSLVFILVLSIQGWLLINRMIKENRGRQRFAKLEALHKLVRTATSSLDVNEILNQVLLQVVKTTTCNGGVIWLSGVSEQKPSHIASTPSISLALINRILSTLHSELKGDEIVVINLYKSSEGEQFPELVALNQGEVRQQVALANILVAGQIAGAIALYNADKTFSRSDLDFLRSTGLATAEAIENARQFEVVRSSAEIDSVTGLYNHRAVHHQLDIELKRAGRALQPLAIIMMDINSFKLLNDNYGHPVGDAVLRQTANCLTSICRDTDIVARYGGDEFIAVLVNTTAEEADRLVQRLMDKVNTSPYHTPDKSKEVEFRLSFGVSVFPSDGEDVSTLVAVADSRLYEAKRERAVSTQKPLQLSDEGAYSSASFVVLEQMVDSIGKKDGYLHQHIQTVADLSMSMARILGLSEESMRSLRIVSLLHDIGMVGVPEYLLLKSTPLTHEEMEIIRRHATLGAQIVGSVPGMDYVANCIRSHHERYDGSGYPDGLRGDSIPLLSKIVAVADSYAAMTNPRTHRAAKSTKKALNEIYHGANSLFDSTIVDALAAALKTGTENEAA
jgi:diguanylate cyclase (GGDEF)-like protein/putative nucleotidyltransferase with HDIG domain